MGIDLSRIDVHQALVYILVIVLSITVHEFGHAFVADRLGDDTPRRQGRVTLLPTEHLDPIGFLMIVFMAFGGIGLGWGKPVQINPAALRHPRRDDTLITLAGPFANLVLACIAGLTIRFFQPTLSGLAEELATTFLFVNLSLMFFNLIPIPPLDGSHVMVNVLPREPAMRYARVMGQYGFMILIALIFFGGPFLYQLIERPSLAVATLITGVPFGG
jgi:Zn-dependent protease